MKGVDGNVPQAGKSNATPTMVLEAYESGAPNSFPSHEEAETSFDVASAKSIPAGTACRVLL